LKEALRKRDPATRTAALEAIAEQKSDKSEQILRDTAQKGKKDDAITAARLLGGYRSPETVNLLLDLTRKKSVGIRVTAIDALSRIGTVRIMPAVERALKSRDWPVRAAAVRALAKIRKKETIDLLIAQLEGEEGRLAGEIAAALRDLTGNSLGTGHDHWKAWWDANREKFTLPKRGGRGVGAGPGTTTYYGIPVVSTHIVFCLDVSGSMSTVPVRTESLLDQAKAELTRVLKALPAETRLNIVFFNDQIHPWHKRVVSLKKERDKALAAVAAIQSSGGTNVYDTLDQVFSDQKVDTIYLFSDGEPTSGKITNPIEILQEIRRKNLARQIIINTISLGPSAFLERLAHENNGSYVEIE
ncbi:MAG: HEAT repeat domain-containing protein, partial [Planctomycetota bacterium]